MVVQCAARGFIAAQCQWILSIRFFMTRKATAVTARISPLAAWAARFAAASTDRFSIRELPFLAQVGLRGESTLKPNTWIQDHERHVLWLGPDESLVTAPGEGILQTPGAV